MPELEIVCPVRNGGMHFAATLRSLRGQGGPGCSVLVSDNHSTDGNPWQEAVPELIDWEVRIIKPEAELGRVEHWNWAAGQSGAKLVKIVMSGDQMEPGTIASMREAFAREPALSLVFGQNRILEQDKQYVSGVNHPGGLVTHQEFVALSLRYFGFIGTLSGVVFRGEVLGKALPFEKDYAWAADWRLYARCLQQGPAWYLPQPSCVLDRRIARFSSSARVIGRSLREEWAFHRELSRLAPGDPAGRFLGRLKRVGFHAVVKYGRAFIPRPIRKAMGACYRVVARPGKP